MSEILTREQVNDHQKAIYRNVGQMVSDTNSDFTAVDDMGVEVMNQAESLRDSHFALHDAHDAALEALRFYADEEHYAHSGAVGTWDDTGLGMAFLAPDMGARARAALAAVATPQGQEVNA